MSSKEKNRAQVFMGIISAAYGNFLMLLAVILAPTLGISAALGGAFAQTLGLLLWGVCRHLSYSGAVFSAKKRCDNDHPGFLFLSSLMLTIGKLAGARPVFLSIGGWLGIPCGPAARYTSTSLLASRVLRNCPSAHIMREPAQLTWLCLPMWQTAHVARFICDVGKQVCCL